MNLAHIEAVLFDAVGTLIRARQPIAATYYELGRRHGFELAEAEVAARCRRAIARQDALDAERHAWRTDEAREHRRWRDIVDDIFAETGMPAPREALFEDLWNRFALPETWATFDDAGGTIPPLIERGLTVGLVSNFDARLEVIARQLPPLDLCQRLFISSRIGFRKPSANFFRAVSTQLGIGGDRLLMVGDDPANDYGGARAAGWNAILIDRESNGSQPASITSLDELLAMLPLRV
jgi:putative hydrolase of the HAD superfamily